eukprot:COSAG01_NODE_724_length_14056_cov_41.795443_18_plen_80_part_00
MFLKIDVDDNEEVAMVRKISLLADCLARATCIEGGIARKVARCAVAAGLPLSFAIFIIRTKERISRSVGQSQPVLRSLS